MPKVRFSVRKQRRPIDTLTIYIPVSMDTTPRGGVIQQGADMFIFPVGKSLEWAIIGVEQSVQFHTARFWSPICRAIFILGGTGANPPSNLRITYGESSRLHWTTP